MNKITPNNINENVFNLIGKDWMLITAKSDKGVNSMTASWGGLGVMWNKNVCYIVLRPQRYTKEFVDFAESFSLCFFDEDYKKVLSYMGRVSGRYEDKIKNSGLTLNEIDNIPYFSEAKLVLACKKLFAQEFLSENFIEKGLIEANYPNNDYHTLYIAEITDCFTKEK